MNLEIGYYPFEKNYGFYIDKVPENVLKELGKEIDKLQSNFSQGEKYNHKLAGEIKYEYIIPLQPQTERYIQELSQRFENESQYMHSNFNPVPNLKFDNLWVNFQKKHEYNPLHQHSGVYSFVIWYQVPYLFENERNQFGYGKEPMSINHGQFHFIYAHQNSLSINPLDIDKTKEGYITIFPSNLPHLVHPFYSSDEYRITVAGNILPSNMNLWN